MDSFSKNIASLVTSLPTRFFKKAAATSPHLLKSDIASINHWLGGGLPSGKVYEWGLPPGQNTRSVILSFLRERSDLCLWIYNGSERKVYPPSWAAKGVDLDKTYFVDSARPVDELKCLFMEKLFSFIVIDSPERLSKADMAFLSAQARRFGISIFVLRGYYLSPLKGNPFASVRLNCSYIPSKASYLLRKVRGNMEQQKLVVKEDRVLHYAC
ncbi:MAG: hypothetical protein AB8E15_02595 [Bdellovibrionales bacterium]